MPTYVSNGQVSDNVNKLKTYHSKRTIATYPKGQVNDNVQRTGK